MDRDTFEIWFNEMYEEKQRESLTNAMQDKNNELLNNSYDLVDSFVRNYTPNSTIK